MQNKLYILRKKRERNTFKKKTKTETKAEKMATTILSNQPYVYIHRGMIKVKRSNFIYIFFLVHSRSIICAYTCTYFLCKIEIHVNAFFYTYTCIPTNQFTKNWVGIEHITGTFFFFWNYK